MKSIQVLFEKKYHAHWLILACLIADAFFFYSHGIIREYFANQAYIEFIHNFPESIASVRQEPLFIILSYWISNLIGSAVGTIIFLKMSIIALQLFIFYKIVKLLVKDEIVALLAIPLLNFSFAYLSLADNLLRNHLANLFFLCALYHIIRIMRPEKHSSKDTVLAALYGGLLIYAHILPTIIFDASIILTLSTVVILEIIKRLRSSSQSADSRKFRVFHVRTIRALILVGFSAAIIQSPYIFRLISTQAGVSDYKSAAVTAPNIQQKSIPSQVKSSIASQPESIPSIPLSTFLRTLFEFRLPGFPLFAMILLLFALIFMTKSITSAPQGIIILSLWIISYIGSKTDLLLGIGTLPYRFSLMLIFPTILAVLILIDHFVSRIKSPVARVIFPIIITLSFIGTNIPFSTEATVLKNYTENMEKETFLAETYRKAFDRDESRIFLTNGDSFEKQARSSVFLRNDSLFSTIDESEIIRFMLDHRARYVIYDHNRIDEKGNDIGTTINTNIETYDHSSYFTKVGEYIGTGTHITLYRFYPNQNAPRSQEKSVITCSDETTCIQNLSARISKSGENILSWQTKVSQSTSKITIREFPILSSGNTIEIRYDSAITLQNIFLQKGEVHLYDFSEKRSLKKEATVSISSALLLLSQDGISISYRNLEKYSVDKYVYSGVLLSNKIRFSALTRDGYRLLIHVLFLIAILIVFAMSSILQKYHSGSWNVFKSDSRSISMTISIMIILSILDMLFISMFFTEIYKKLLEIQ